MTLLVCAVLVLCAGGFLALVASSRPRAALLAGSAAAVVASVLGLAAASRALLGAAPEALRVPWSAPFAELHLRLDPLSAFFLAALFAVALPATVYGVGYMRPYLGRRSLGLFVCAYDLLLAAIAVVFTARDGVLFLVAWEVMAATSFLLVVFEHERPDVRRAGLVYLVASHIGTAFLFAFFVLLGRHAGSFDMDTFAALRASAGPGGVLFALAVVGFGTKAGLAPLHVWLPEAHPAAPSHVSAVLSAVMIKTGVYGILRALTFLPVAPAGWGYALAAVGAASGVVAITLALAQRDLKRALAYSSVENVGIIALGLGVALVAAAHGEPAVAVLGFAGALLHVWNHSLMKGLAFMGAGAIAHASHTRDLEKMGGLLKRLPATGTLFLVATAALAALPPLNGFASEWLVYMGLLGEAGRANDVQSLVALVGVTSLVFTGAIAAVAFTRLGGIALLGAPRSAAAAQAHEPGWIMTGPLTALAAGCVALGLFPDAALRLAGAAIGELASATGIDVGRAAPELDRAARALAAPARIAAVTLAAVALAAVVASRRLRAARGVATSETWGCGFTRPTSRIEYTASSYAQLFLFEVAPRWAQPRGELTAPKGLFPRRASLANDPQDPARARLFDPMFARLADRCARLRRFQADRLNLQLFYTVLTVLVLAAALWLRKVLV